jgi:ABC-2 type transport system permease protein
MCVRLRMEGNGVGDITATVATPGEPNFTAHVRTFFAIAVSGFHRHSTYRQATVAAAATNCMFGFLRTYILLSVVGATGLVVGYSAPQLATYVWAGQGLIGVVMFWGWTDLSERVRSGDIVTDLLRPIHPVISYLATDLGRAAHATLSRFLPPLLVGAVFFDLYRPVRPATYPVFALSALLAVMASFGCRYLVNAAAYWLLDIRGVQIVWMLTSGVLSGLYFPLRFLPEWLATGLWVATPFPSILQTPLDVAVERDRLPVQLGYVALQAGWVVVLLLVCRVVQRRAERRLVVQGG